MIIVIDPRGHNRLPKTIASLGRAVSVEELDVGDVFAITDTGLTVGVEIKSVPDLLHSWTVKSREGKWRSGHLLRQLRNLRKHRDVSILAIYGHLETDTDGYLITHWITYRGTRVPQISGWHHTRLQAAFVSWQSHGIFIPPFAQTLNETAEAVCAWLDVLNKQNHHSLIQPLLPLPTANYLDTKLESMITSLMCIPGIGEKTAQNIYREIGNWVKLSQAEVADIQKTPGVGVATATRIYEWMRMEEKLD